MEPKGERYHYVSFTSKANRKDNDHTVVELGNIDMQDLLEPGDHQTQPYYVNSLSSWEMDTLTALCDTFLPSVDVSDVNPDESVVKFFSTSASMAGTPERVGICACMLFFSSINCMDDDEDCYKFDYIFPCLSLIIFSCMGSFYKLCNIFVKYR